MDQSSPVSQLSVIWSTVVSQRSTSDLCVGESRVVVWMMMMMDWSVVLAVLVSVSVVSCVGDNKYVQVALKTNWSPTPLPLELRSSTPV